LTGANDRLYFVADDGVSGYELWALNVPRRPVLNLAFGNNAILLRVISDPAQEQIVEHSEDLRAWNIISTNAADTNGVIQLTNAVNGSNEFFRTRTLLRGAR